MRWSLIACVGALLLALGGCAGGYAVVPARMGIGNVSPDSFPAVAAAIHDFLVGGGFEDFGKSREEIALIRQDNLMPPGVKQEILARLERERDYLDRKHNLRVVLMDYTGGVPPEIMLNYLPLSERYVELEIYDDRPGGFGPYGLAFYQRLETVLTRSYGASLQEIQAPPPTDWKEYRRLRREEVISASIALFLAFVIPFLVTGMLSRCLLSKINVSVLLKRVIFSVVNAWLVAPLPFPAALIVIPLPNLFAFPWIWTTYYKKVGSFAAVSFLVTLLLCVGASLFMIKGEGISVRARDSHLQ